MQNRMKNLNVWPPESFTEASAPTPISIRQMADSLRSSNQTERQSFQDNKLSKQAEKTGKTFHNTPYLDNQRCTLERAPERSDGAPSGANHKAPQLVIRGANGHDDTDGPAVSIDWLRMSGPRSMRWHVLRLLESFFGESVPGKGRFFLNSSFQFASGGMFFDEGKDENRDNIVIELPGSLLAELKTLDEIQQLATELMQLGCKAVRTDIAVDLYEHSEIIDVALESCRADHLTGAKTYQHIATHSKGMMTGHGLNIGKRGKNGSGRYLRIYDKGLETQTQSVGDWIRWEAELADDCARKFVESFIDSQQIAEVCLAHAFGVCDFRTNPGRKLARRKRCEWYQDFIGEIDPQRVRISRVASTIHTKIRWVRRCVAPSLRTIQRVTGHKLDRVVQEITGPVETNEKYLEDTLVRSVCDTLGVPPTQLHKAYRSGSGHG